MNKISKKNIMTPKIQGLERMPGWILCSEGKLNIQEHHGLRTHTVFDLL